MSKVVIVNLRFDVPEDKDTSDINASLEELGMFVQAALDNADWDCSPDTVEDGEARVDGFSVQEDLF